MHPPSGDIPVFRVHRVPSVLPRLPRFAWVLGALVTVGLLAGGSVTGSGRLPEIAVLWCLLFGYTLVTIVTREWATSDFGPEPRGTPAAAVYRLLLAGKLRSGSGNWIDVEAYEAVVGREGPRVIAIGSTALPPSTHTATEPVAIGLARAITPAERRLQIVMASVMGCLAVSHSLIVMLMASRTPLPPIESLRMWVFTIGIWTLAAWVTAVALYRLGVRPFQLGGAVAAPGRVEVLSPLGRVTEFRSDDSVLIAQLHDLGNICTSVAVDVVRRDGAHYRTRFYAGLEDPVLRALFAHWQAVDGTPGRTGGGSA